MYRGRIKKSNSKGSRLCSECGKKFIEGYCVYDGKEYYCSDKCLDKRYSASKYVSLYRAGLAYYSRWGNSHE